MIHISAEAALHHCIDLAGLHPVDGIILVRGGVITDPAREQPVINPASQTLADHLGVNQWYSGAMEVWPPVAHIVLSHPAADTLQHEDVVGADVEDTQGVGGGGVVQIGSVVHVHNGAVTNTEELGGPLPGPGPAL